MRRFHAVYAVWGDSYTGLFVDVALPTLVGQVARLAVSDRPRYSCKIYTTSRDARRVRESAPFAVLARSIEVEILLIDDLDVEKNVGMAAKLGMMAECHRRAVVAALRDKAILIFLSPDTFWSDGMLPILQRHADAGIRVVLLPGLRARRESAVPVVLRRFRSSDGTSLSIPSRELVGVMMEYLHAFTEPMILNSGTFDGRWPSNVYWRVGREGLLARCFHLHPLMVDPAGLETLPESVLDNDLVCRLPLTPKDWHIVDDSDEIVHCDLCTEAMGPEPGPVRPVGLFRIAVWAANNTNADHRRYFETKIRLHSGELSPRWAAVERESDRAARIVGWLLLVRPLLFDVRAYLSRIRVLRRAYLAVRARLS